MKKPRGLLLVFVTFWLSQISFSFAQDKLRPIVAVFEIELNGLTLKKVVVERLNIYLETKVAASGYRVVPRDQIKVLIFEEAVCVGQRSALEGVCRFLGIDPSFRFRRVEAKRNENRGSRLGSQVASRLSIGRGQPTDSLANRVVRRVDSLFPSTLEQPSERVVRGLRDIYRKSNKELAELLGRTELWPD